jgi:hypothetical protein
MLALLEPGDEVIYPNPGFPIYESMIRTLGATPVPMPLVESRGFSLDLNLLREKLSRRHEDAGAEFAAQSYRGSDSGRGHASDRGDGAGARFDRPVRRNLFADLL